MIFILSIEDDMSTDDVIDYLIHYGQKFVRINATVVFDHLYIQIKDGYYCIMLQKEEITINLTEITNCWYRRGEIVIRYAGSVIPKELSNSKLYTDYLNYLQSEFKYVMEFI